MTGSLVAPLVRLAAGLYRAAWGTLRVEFTLGGAPASLETYPDGPEIFALSERDALGLGAIIASSRFTVLVAHGRDGDWTTTVVESLGARAVRGATRRGGARAFSDLVAALEAGDGPVGLVVDGPLGPEGEAKGGAVACAAATGRPLRPVAAAASRCLVIRGSWSRIWAPLPFARLVVCCGAPLAVPRGASREERRELTEALSRGIAAMRRDALEKVHRGSGRGAR